MRRAAVGHGNAVGGLLDRGGVHVVELVDLVVRVRDVEAAAGMDGFSLTTQIPASDFSSPYHMENAMHLLLFWCLSGEMEDEVMLCAAAGCISEVSDIVMRLLAEVEELEDESEADCGCE